MGATPQAEGLVRARGRVCFHNSAPALRGRSLSINPSREGHREPLRAGRINAAGWPDHAGQPAGSPARSPSRSFRINAQRRSCFRWTDDAPRDVEIVDLSLGGERDMNAKNGKRPAHPGEVLREEAEIAEQVTPRHAVVWRRR